MSSRGARKRKIVEEGREEQLPAGEISLGSRALLLEREEAWKEQESLLNLLRELAAASYGLRPLSPSAREKLQELYRREIITTTPRVQVSPKYLPVVIAGRPPWKTFYIVGKPGVGKTTGIRQLAEMEAEALGRELIDVKDLVESAGDIETAINDILRNLEKYYLYSYVTGGEITREFYGVPVGAFATLEDLLKLKTVGRAQAWQVPPRILLLTVEGEALRRLEESLAKSLNIPRHRLSFILDQILSGSFPAPCSSEEWLRKLLSEMMRSLPVGMLVIDEALQAFPEFVNYYLMPLAGERVWQSRRLSPFARLILIWNPPEYNEAVQTPPIPAMRRGVLIEVTEPSLEDMWKYFLRTVTGLPAPPSWMKALLRTIALAGVISSGEEMRESPEKMVPYTTPAGIVTFLQELLSSLYSLGYPEISPPLEAVEPIAVMLARSLLSPKHVSLIRNFFTLHVPSGKELLANPELFRETINRYEKEGKNIIAKYRMLIELASALQAPPEVLRNPEMLGQYMTERANQLLNFIERNKGLINPVDLDILLNLVAEAPGQESYAAQLLLTLARMVRGRPELEPLIKETISRIIRAGICQLTRT